MDTDFKLLWILKMETKLITKTIKELADEYDGNVEQLHRTINSKSDEIKYLEIENYSLRVDIRLKKWEREMAEIKTEVSMIILIIVCVLCASFTVYNYLFG